jgi:hypothetical protein
MSHDALKVPTWRDFAAYGRQVLDANSALRLAVAAWTTCLAADRGTHGRRLDLEASSLGVRRFARRPLRAPGRSRPCPPRNVEALLAGKEGPR